MGGHRLRMFKNREVRKIFSPKGQEVRVGWRKVHNEELHNLCSSPSTVWVIVRNKESECSRAADKRGEVHKYLQDFGGEI
jgi:hypothetical protein